MRIDLKKEGKNLLKALAHLKAELLLVTLLPIPPTLVYYLTPDHGANTLALAKDKPWGIITC